MHTNRSSRRAPAHASPPLSLARKLAAAFITIALLPVVYLASAEAAGLELRVSAKSDRSAATALAGATLAGNMYAFVPRDGVSRVEFWVDDPSMVGSRFSLDRRAEFDLAGTLRSGLARPFDTTRVADGSHTVTARVRSTDGTTSVLHATFTVANVTAPTTPTTTAPTTTAPTTTVPPTTQPAYVDRVSAGSSADVTDATGAVWSADHGAVGGSVMAGGGDIAGTDNDMLYGKHRWGMTGYSLAVPCVATYGVDLHLAEIAALGAGQRVFDVTAEGTTRLSRIDVAATAGWGTALVRSFDVAVGDGALDLGFVAVVEDPMVSAIAVRQLTACGNTTTPTTTAPPASPTTTTTAPPASPTTTTTAPPASPTTTTTVPPSSPPPSTTGFPNASNTGVPAGTVLRPSEELWVYTAGAVIDGLDVNGCIHVRANNVTIKRTRVRGACPGGTIDTDYGAYSGILIEDVELDGLNMVSGYAMLGNSGFTCRRCNIHHGGSGIRMTSNVVVEDSWIHDLYGEPGSHNSAIGSNGGRNFVLRHNTIDCGNLPQCSGALVFYAQPSVDNALVENNLINGGGYCTYGGYDPYNPGAGTYIRYINNRFGRTYYPNCGFHGPVVWFNVNNTGNAWSGNVWHDTGLPV